MEPFLGEIRMVGFNFAPRGWALCDGQLLAISQYTALFSLLATTYGGDGRSTFGLPDLRGRVPVHMGQSPGLSTYILGEKSGAENVALALNEMPQHSHDINVHNQPANQTDPSGNIISVVNDGSGRTPNLYPAYSNAAPTGKMASSALGTTGASQPHSNMQPFLVVNFVIALEGIFPSRN